MDQQCKSNKVFQQIKKKPQKTIFFIHLMMQARAPRYVYKVRVPERYAG